MYRNILVLSDGTEISSGPGTKNAIKNTKTTQMVNSGEELTIGSACSNMLEATLFTPAGNLNLTAGDEITHYKIDDGGNRTQMGLYTIEEPTRPTANTLQLVGYDRVSKLDKDLTTWLESLNGWPYTVNTFAAMVCRACGVSFAEQNGVPNGDFPIRRWKKSNATGRKIMRWLGEIVCCYVYADPSGNIRFGWYRDSGKSYAAAGNNYYFSGSLSYENYQVAPVEAVQIRLADTDNGAVWPTVPDGTNSYIITGNPILTAYVTDDLLPYLGVIERRLAAATYTPCELAVQTTMDVNAGDIVQVTDKNGKTISTYIMSKITSGQRDTLSGTGSQRRDSTSTVNNKTEAEKQADMEAVANSAANKAQSNAEKKTEELDKALDQEEVFNRLTNGGKSQGIYMLDGVLYINATYIKSGEMIADLLKAGILQSKDGKTFYLDLEKGVLKGQFDEFSVSGKTVDAIAQEKADTAENNAKSYANTAAANAVSKQTQRDIFNKLTNNGALPGLYMKDNQLYINASYLKSGTIDANLVKVANLVAERLASESGTSKLSVDSASLKISGTSGTTVNLTNFEDGTAYLYFVQFDENGQDIGRSQYGANRMSIGGTWISPTIGFFSKDGKPQLQLAGDVAPKYLSWKNNGDGTYTPIGTY